MLCLNTKLRLCAFVLICAVLSIAFGFALKIVLSPDAATQQMMTDLQDKPLLPLQRGYCNILLPCHEDGGFNKLHYVFLEADFDDAHSFHQKHWRAYESAEKRLEHIVQMLEKEGWPTWPTPYVWTSFVLSRDYGNNEANGRWVEIRGEMGRLFLNYVRRQDGYLLRERIVDSDARAYFTRHFFLRDLWSDYLTMSIEPKFDDSGDKYGQFPNCLRVADRRSIVEVDWAGSHASRSGHAWPNEKRLATVQEGEYLISPGIGRIAYGLFLGSRFKGEKYISSRLQLVILPDSKTFYNKVDDRKIFVNGEEVLDHPASTP